MNLTVFSAAERPDLAAVGLPSEEIWPEYNLHGDDLNAYWEPLWVELPEYQLLVVDESETIVAELQTAPLAWDGVDEHLPIGIDVAIRDAVEGRRAGTTPTALCAMAAEIAPAFRGAGLATVGLEAMRTLAVSHGLTHLIAPVRPSEKHRYPLTPIEEYCSWRRSDGLSPDPWIRVHQRLGARIAGFAPRSMRISGSVAEWESWIGLPLPATGTYVFPEGLAPLEVDRAADVALYYEPNVWLVHDLNG